MQANIMQQWIVRWIPYILSLHMAAAIAYPKNGKMYVRMCNDRVFGKCKQLFFII